MKIQIWSLLLFLILPVLSFSQFKKGYYLTNDSVKIEGLIKYNSLKNNPVKFKFKKSEDSEISKIHQNEAKEFSIYGDVKFVRANVMIDSSSIVLERLSADRNPKFVSKEVYLEVLEEGAVNLYSYIHQKNYKYFIRAKNEEIQQLVYKRYLVINTGNTLRHRREIKHNNYFKQQLKNYLKCNAISLKKFKKLKYFKKDLREIIKENNQCINE
ncbi:hypothetical protein [Aureivirga marina]|uniref:hypothetical protein n=1 Tax=Aureivirga marina TaxID=1182451 RepID=UPI0018CA7A4A|nr:hypothetical protein [Aureivirga marina]